ncbi:MAG TPA: hypothetical protein VNB64_07435, partial [Solirubrobacteraceae bacterium]|nr:hypothetical protein [Solirubrobacteraceae bacterium]
MGLRLRGCLSVAGCAAALLAAPGPASGSAYDCQGDNSATGFPTPRPTDRRLTFGIFPGGTAGAVVGPQRQGKPEDPAKILAALAQLRGGRPFVAHLYLSFTGRPDQAARVAEAKRQLAMYAGAGLDVEFVLTYRPQDRRGEADVVDYVAFVRRMVAELGPMRGLKSLQVTNEVTNTASPDASDGAYPGAREALVRGIVAAKAEARARGLQRLQIGFNWFYRLDPQTEQEFWTFLRDRGGPAFVGSLDWVGLDAYPGTYFPPPPVPRGSSLLNAMSLLRECLMPIANIPKSIPIHITENGWPTGAGRTPDEQAVALREMVQAAHDHRGTYNVTDYRWFSLRDGDSADPDFQQGYGIMFDDYRPKPAFGPYRDLIARLGPPPVAPGTMTPGRGGRRPLRPRLRIAVRPRSTVTGRLTRLRFLVTRPAPTRARPGRRL